MKERPKTQLVSMQIPPALVQAIDQLAERQYTTRSEFKDNGQCFELEPYIHTLSLVTPSCPRGLVGARIQAVPLVHGHAGIDSPEYRSWRGMRDRCLNPNVSNYSRRDSDRSRMAETTGSVLARGRGAEGGRPYP
jgi:hypothetical protein